MTQTLYTHRLDNGLVLLAEVMDWVESAAFALLVPAGCNRDPESQAGLANLTCEMVQRGAGRRDSRQFLDDLEMLGAETSAGVSNSHTSFGGAMPAESIFETLAMYADVVRRPHLPADQFEDARLSCLQEVRAIEDNLPQKLFQQLRLRRYEEPFGRSSSGTVESVEQLRDADVTSFFQQNFLPENTILSVAGKIDWPRLREHVEKIFGDWPTRPRPPLKTKPAPRGYQHIPHDSQQTLIGLAVPGVSRSHPDYFQALGAVDVLGSGMSSRLFSEVREKRGLCYEVSAFLDSLRDCGSLLCYAGSTSERAQETLDVILGELRRLSSGIEPAELTRVKAGLKSHLIMQQESSGVRSRSMAGHWYYLGRIQPIDELRQIFDALSCESINRYLAANPPRDFTIVTLGPHELEVSGAVS